MDVAAQYYLYVSPKKHPGMSPRANRFFTFSTQYALFDFILDRTVTKEQIR